MDFKGRLLVLGGGFIGTAILKRYPTAVAVTRSKIDKNEHYSWPVSFKKWLELILAVNPEGIIVCFGSSLVKNIQENPDLSYKEQITKIMAFLDAINTLKNTINLKKIVIVGSAAEYGSLINQSITELASPNDINTYGCLKLGIYHICNFYYEFHHLPICYVRQFNTSGPGQTTDFVLPSLVSQYLNYFYGFQEKMNVGDLEIYRDFIHIDDALDGYDTLLQKGIVGQCYNLCSNKVKKLKSTLDYLTNKFGKSPDFIVIDKLKREENERKNYILGNNDKLKSLGWSPKKTFEDILEDIVDFELKKHIR